MREWGLTPPLWRDLPEADRDLLLAESVLVCPSCGNLKSYCSKPGLQLYPQRDECFVTAAREFTIRRLHKKYEEEPSAQEIHPLDGVNVWMAESDIHPEDRFFDLPGDVLEKEHEAPEHDDGDA
jgi:hypothetical protein